MSSVSTAGQFPLLDMPAGNNGSCIQRCQGHVLLNTTTISPYRHVSQRESGIEYDFWCYNEPKIMYDAYFSILVE